MFFVGNASSNRSFSYIAMSMCLCRSVILFIVEMFLDNLVKRCVFIFVGDVNLTRIPSRHNLLVHHEFVGDALANRVFFLVNNHFEEHPIEQHSGPSILCAQSVLSLDLFFGSSDQLGPLILSCICLRSTKIDIYVYIYGDDFIWFFLRSYIV